MRPALTVIVLAVFVFPFHLSAQKTDIGFQIGSTLYFGDLGGANAIGRPLFFDLERTLIKPVGSAFYHRQLNTRWGIKVIGSYTSIAGDDKLLQPRSLFSPEWFRWYRNLNFHSNLWDVSVWAEYYLTRYEPGSISRWRWGPYAFVGVGLFHFNPKTEVNGTTVELRPLHTEGQGFPGSGRKEYSLYQPSIPIGFGLRYNVTTDFTIAFEYADHWTFTDYIDDVSTEYVSQSDFNSYFANDPATASLAWQLSVRSDEIDPDGIYAYVTAPGQQRGDPKDKDHYAFPQFTFSWVMGQHHVRPKNQMKCMKWGGEGNTNKKARKPTR